MLKMISMTAGAFALLIAGPAHAQNVDVLIGGRGVADDGSLAYLSVTGDIGTYTTSGLVVRAEAEQTNIEFGGDSSKQNAQRLLLGYAWSNDAGSYSVLAGPTHVTRSVNGGPDEISETGLYVGAEGSGFIGDRGFWAGIAQWSDPEEAFYTRAFSTYLVGGNTNIGPDFSYYHEDAYDRTTLGLRAAWSLDQAVLAIIGGASLESGDAGNDEEDGFLELQLGFSF